MHLHPLRRSLAAIFCLSPLSVFSQAGVPELDTVVVTASRAPQALGDAMGDITVVGREELQRAGNDSVVDILARQPGVQITDTGGRQTPTGVMLRGANPNHTLVLIDGMRINGSIQGGVNWGAIDPALIERIEILRGAASSLYGSDAIGGVINIITRKGETDRPLSGWADIGIGSYETFKAATGFSGASNGWDYSLSASMAESGGYSTTTPEAAFGNHHPDDDGYSQHTLAGSLGYRWAPGHHLGASFYNSYINGDYDSGQWSHPAYALTRQQAYTVTSTNDITANWQSVLRFGLSKESYDDRAWGTTFSSLQRSYSWQNNVRLSDDHKVSAYVERLEERPVHSAGMDVTRRNTNAVGAIYNGRFGRHSLQASLRNDNISGYGNEFTGGLGYDLALNDAWTVGVAGNTGFHAPTFSDLYYPGSENPDLNPEKSRNVEAHVRYDRDGLRFGATVYQNKIRDLLTWDNATFRMENVDRATIRGATLTAEYEWDDTTLRASADFMRPRDDNTGERLLRRARQQYMLAAEHRLDALRLGAEYRYTGKREDTAVDAVTFASYRTTLAGYSLVNLTAAYDFSPNASIQLRWNNVFDKDYANAYGYQTSGSNFFLNLSLRM
ncbi:TonB-dependent receptor [Alcaligenaceae bacterium]|nr:TonB-dependent receptor [Alcaligenaceae bacterium]